MWDERYAKDGFLFGTEPAAFLTAAISYLKEPSRVLCVADGEGRNSVYLAQQGHAVTAFDASQVGLDKAMGLARHRDVRVDYHLSTVADWDWDQTYDAVVAIFIQFLAPEERAEAFDAFRRAVRPGGLLMLHGYAPRQVDYGTGGPPLRAHMYTEDLLEAQFSDWQILRLADYDAVLSEGPGHSGRSGLVDLIARRTQD
ncbi:MAG: class I SAM-dependent methyltransferase [Pseudomonadota bacterium]